MKYRARSYSTNDENGVTSKNMIDDIPGLNLKEAESLCETWINRDEVGTVLIADENDIVLQVVYDQSTINKKRCKIRDLEGSEIDRLDNLGVAVQALVEAEIEECNKESVVHRKENLEALQAVIKVLRRTFHDG